MIALRFDMISRYERRGEFVETAVPFPESALPDASKLMILDGKGARIRPQARVTSRWPDASIKFVHLSFLADLPGAKPEKYFLSADGGIPDKTLPAVKSDLKNRVINTGVLEAVLAGKGESRLFESLKGPSFFDGSEIEGPVLSSGATDYLIKLEEDWEFCEEGPYRVIVRNGGRHYDKNGRDLFSFTVRLHFTAGHPWFQVEYRFTHREDAAELPLEALTLRVKEDDPQAAVALGISNYKTRIQEAPARDGLEKLIDAEYLLYESNEQIPEVNYGTFFADWRKNGKGICATIFQAQQNFPKALRADGKGILVSLMPGGQAPVRILQGMEKTHSVFFHLHDGRAGINELDCRSLQMQMPDRPLLEPETFRAAGVLENVIPAKPVPALESRLRSAADSTGRAYGMLAWGDAVDAGYTNQGRGNGEPVWTNQEYDYPHANMLMYARSGERRYLDKLLVSARHWMDVDICHYSKDPLRTGGQVMHSARHVTGHLAPSHEWVEGLLDYYHLTGDRRGLDSALGIGRNILRLLETPDFQRKGEISARETGWALRSLTALYIETNDETWLARCEWIVGHFAEWREEFGHWLSPYTSNTIIRVPFMISVAVNSLMRYYRVRPSALIKEMIIGAMDDLLENTRLCDGQFIYKELPSLNHTSANTIALEALAYAYELTGDKKYLEGGMELFRSSLGSAANSRGGEKQVIGDALVMMGSGTKPFAQSHISLAVFGKALESAGICL
ncbi:MAG: hypothetical protein LBH26_01520 [Treponema sp.]|jgi:hypothetical protein|nr:hypothetical protein [Treponema sp.]